VALGTISVAGELRRQAVESNPAAWATGLVAIAISALASAFPVHRILRQEIADVLRESL